MASVMIVEDDRDTREMLGRFLELEGFDVRTAANGQLALEALDEDGSAPTVILLDLMMPVMNGWQFLEQLAVDTRLDAVPVVIMTAMAAPDEALLARATAILHKPYDIDDLLNLVDRHCG